MSLPPIIGVYAPARQSGKSTVANVFVQDHGYVLAKFAAPLYLMFETLCKTVGLPEEMIRRATTGDLKETPFQQLAGLSFRSFAEGVGTEWGRRKVSETIWVDIGRQYFRTLLEIKGVHLVVDDVRFPNEGDVIKELGGVVLAVYRPVFNGGLEPSLPSEGHMKNYGFDTAFLNNGTVEDLQSDVRCWANVLIPS